MGRATAWRGAKSARRKKLAPWRSTATLLHPTSRSSSMPDASRCLPLPARSDSASRVLFHNLREGEARTGLGWLRIEMAWLKISLKQNRMVREVSCCRSLLA
uniref:Uncharacterized protein n=1 Tax=Arundo donax TaxID=35708 RepID=A0A0A9DG66_ARUDO